MVIGSAINGNFNFVLHGGKAQLYQWSSYNITQSYTEEGYLVTVEKNGTLKESVINTDPRMFDNVVTGGCLDWNLPAKARLRNLVIKTHEGK